MLKVVLAFPILALASSSDPPSILITLPRMDILLSPRKRRRDVKCVVVRDTQAKASPSTLSSREDSILDSSLEAMLRDQKQLAAFRAFLRSEFSEENLDFWLACEAFRDTSSSGERGWKAEHIYQEFLHPNARREVNVDHLTREKIQGLLAEQRPPAWCFAEAQRNIYLLMERDTWPRFLRSGACNGLSQKTSTVWYI
ncbi:unnamed protein product [Arctogadus glacialis]